VHNFSSKENGNDAKLSRRVVSFGSMKIRMKLSFYGKVIHFYMWFGKFVIKVSMILICTLLVSLILMLSVPQFSLHEPGVEISHYVPLAIAQVIVTSTFLVSLVGGIAFEIPAGCIALLEIPIEIFLKKRVYKLVKEKRKISIDELVRETGVLENDLSFLIKNWIMRPMTEDIYKVDRVTTGMAIRGHMQFNIGAKELYWQE